MRYSDNSRNVGDKLLPKIIAAVSQSVIATKKGLGPTEHKIRMQGMREFMNWGGEELASLYAPIIDMALNDPDNGMHPEIRKWLEQVASGSEQWKALGGILLGGVSGSIGQSISNALSPATYHLNALFPNTIPDAGTVVQSVAQRLTTQSEANTVLNQLAVHPGWYSTLYQMAQTIPDYNTLNDLKYRGQLTDARVDYYLGRSAVPDDIIAALKSTRFSILTLADAALAYLRSDITYPEAERIAAENGYDKKALDVFIGNTGEPPGIMQLLEAYRRGFINRDRLVRGIRQSRVRNEWVDVVEALRFEPMTTADAIEASIKGYITFDDAKAIAGQNGLEPQHFDASWKAQGEPLSRTEMADLVNRGEATIGQFKEAIRQSRVKNDYIDLSAKLIERPMTIGDAVRGYVQGYLTEEQADKIQGQNGLRASDRKVVREIDGIPLSLTEMLRLMRMGKMTRAQVIQGLKESRLKDKYVEQALELGVYLPSIFELRLMLRDGAITDAEAAKILTEHGYQKEIVTGIIHAFGSSATSASKTITEGMLTDLYLEGAINRKEYLDILHAIGYPPKQSELIAEVAEWRIELQARTALLNRVRAEYVGRHITEADAEGELYRANVPDSVRVRVMSEWNDEIKVTVRLLTPAQVTDAWFLNLFDPSDATVNTAVALDYLQRLAYTPEDALMLLEIKNKGPISA